jgi:hypothetical protein
LRRWWLSVRGYPRGLFVPCVGGDAHHDTGVGLCAGRGRRQRWLDEVAQGERGEQQWLLWDVRSNAFAASLARTYAPAQLRSLAPPLIEWMLDCYFTLQADAEALLGLQARLLPRRSVTTSRTL